MLAAPAPLSGAHVLSGFDSGVPPLDDWLRKRALANHVGGASRVYVVADANQRVLGYYALASGALTLVDAPGSIRRNMPDPIPMAVLGRLAVDRSWQGKGLGAALLKDAIQRATGASAIMGLRGILVHAISDEAKRFYQTHGFIDSPSQPMTLIMSLLQPTNVSRE
jgi:GNAT superfamily N-acetyltransferase